MTWANLAAPNAPGPMSGSCAITFAPRFAAILSTFLAIVPYFLRWGAANSGMIKTSVSSLLASHFWGKKSIAQIERQGPANGTPEWSYAFR
jgi:hypothetical protein